MLKLYGQEPQSLYGRPQNVEAPAGQNAPGQVPGPQAQPSQPGSPAGSQQAAQSSYANFEDIFNRNSTYNKKAVEKTTGKIAGEAQGLEGNRPANSSIMNQGANMNNMGLGFGAANAGNPAQAASIPGPMPAQSLAPEGHAENLSLPNRAGLNDIQARADLLNGYGKHVNQPQQEAPSAYTGGGARMLPQPSQEQPVAYQQADTGTRGGTRNKHMSREAIQKATADQTGLDENGNPINPFGVVDMSGIPDADQTPNIRMPESKKAPVPGEEPPPVDLEREAVAAKEAAAKGAVEEGKSILDQKIAEGNKDNEAKSAAELAKLKQAHEVAQDLGSYGQDNGLALLQETDPEATQWDADMGATAGGRSAFADLNSRFGGNYENDLLSNTAKDITQRQKDLASLQNDRGFLDTQHVDPLLEQYDAEQAAKTKDTGGKKWKPPGFDSFGAFWDGKSTEDSIHEMGTAVSPVDQLWDWMGSMGVDMGRNPTSRGNDYYSGMIGTQGAKTQEIRSAFGNIMHDFGDKQAAWLWDQLTPQMWAAWQGMNKGSIYRAMKELLVSGGRISE